MSKEIKYGSEAQEGLKRGVDALAKAVKVTLGPKGRNVMIDNMFGHSYLTKDGVSVAREVTFEENTLEDKGAQLLKQVAINADEQAGDGTSTSIVLAQAIVELGLKNVAAGANPLDLKKGIDKAVSNILLDLESQSLPVTIDSEKIKQVASISANNDELIGDLIAKAFGKVGKEGVITVEESKGTDTYVDVVEGMQFDRGYLSPYFVTSPEKMTVELDDVLILCHDNKMSDVSALLPILKAVRTKQKPLLIIAEDYTNDILKTLIINKEQGGLEVVAIKSYGYGQEKKDILEDIAILTKGEVISESKGTNLKNIKNSFLGSAKKVTVTNSKTIIVGGAGEEKDIQERVSQIQNNIKNEESENLQDKLRERLSKLSGGVAIINVGADSELEMKEKKDRVVDSLSATRSAIEEGIIAGGGVAFIQSSKNKSIEGDNIDENTGQSIVYEAIERPLLTICSNAGVSGEVVLNRIKDSEEDNFGYDAKSETYVDMLKAGIIDPKKVTRIALENAASVAGMILTTECVILTKNE